MTAKGDDLLHMSKVLPEVMGSYRDFSDNDLESVGKRWPIFLAIEAADTQAIPRLSDAQIELFSQLAPAPSSRGAVERKVATQGTDGTKAVQELLNRLKSHEVTPRAELSDRDGRLGCADTVTAAARSSNSLPQVGQEDLAAPVSDQPVLTGRSEKEESQRKKGSPLTELFARLDRESTGGLFRRQGSFLNKNGKK